MGKPTIWFPNRSDTNRPVQSQKQARNLKGPLTIWPVYAYTLAAQNTVIKLPMLILYTEDNSSMSYEEIRVQTFTYSVIIW